MGEDSGANSTPATTSNWHVMSADEVLDFLDTNRDGLSESEALRRAAEIGPNKLDEETPTHWIWKLVDQYRDPMVYLLLAAAAIAFLFDPEDKGTPIFIVIALSLNGIFGYMQEAKAERASKVVEAPRVPGEHLGGEMCQTDCVCFSPNSVYTEGF